MTFEVFDKLWKNDLEIYLGRFRNIEIIPNKSNILFLGKQNKYIIKSKNKFYII